MGKWATYRKRGGSRPAGPAGPPPAPLLSKAGVHCLCSATGADDTGGFYQLEISLVLPYEFNDYGPPAPWEAVWEFAEEGTEPDGYYRAKEIGNGSTYVGTSPYSNVLTVGAP